MSDDEYISEDSSSEYSRENAHDGISSENINLRKDVYDYKWWDKFRDLGRDAHHEFFCGDHPMQLKQRILEYWIWNNLISYDLVVTLIPDIVNIDFFNRKYLVS